MPAPGEHKTVQARILQYAQEIGWRFVTRTEAEQRRGMKSGGDQSTSGRSFSLFFDALLDNQVRAFNPKYRRPPEEVLSKLGRLPADIHGNRNLLSYLRNAEKFYSAEEKRELDLHLIDFDDLQRPAKSRRNVYEVTEEFSYHNGRYGNREDVVFLINGIPVMVIECKNASKSEAIAFGIDQIRRYHAETPELFVPQMLFTATDSIGFFYGVTWNTVRRNRCRWKDEEGGKLEAKMKSF